MANTNTITNVVPTLLAQGLMALRGACIMPRLVNSDYDKEAKEQGDTIDVPIPSAITAQSVSASYVPPDDAGVVPTKVQVSLDQWYEAPFFLTDKEVLEIMNGFIPMQASEAVKSLARNVNAYILAKYTGIYGYAGVAGTTPFSSDTSEWAAARTVLNNQLCPIDDRRVVLDSDADGNAIQLRAFQDASFRGDKEGITEGQIGRKLGADWFMDQQIPSHTAGTAAGATTDNAGYALGIKTVTLASAGTGTILAGDVFTIAGDTQTYVVVTGDSDVSGGGTVVFEPGLKVVIAAAATAITLKATHVLNLGFHRDAFAFASRPLSDTDFNLGNVKTVVDPVSKIALRLEVTRQHKRTRFSYDILYGAKLVRAELACRIAG